ncbi:hypothetical protein SEA_OCTOBIEN14_126 [Gordonia phage Octobien14]|uniref:Uncharacterized protein n=1 Tax=Gordonia phage Octobien14 TaxID=2483673 RepID=A0A3G3M9Y2_9CAUD|nr:hypothetical protein L3Y22_gp118 [Gordonia phage Octobien14]AYR03261.1 hypothetical protein SEA_OCTOBIEN14_126 [Gordonia phage Octobien14]
MFRTIVRAAAVTILALGGLLGFAATADAAPAPKPKCQIEVGNGKFAPCPPTMPQGPGGLPATGTPLADEAEPEAPKFWRLPKPEEEPVEEEPTEEPPVEEPTDPETPAEEPAQ